MCDITAVDSAGKPSLVADGLGREDGMSEKNSGPGKP